MMKLLPAMSREDGAPSWVFWTLAALYSGIGLMLVLGGTGFLMHRTSLPPGLCTALGLLGYYAWVFPATYLHRKRYEPESESSLFLINATATLLAPMWIAVAAFVIGTVVGVVVFPILFIAHVLIALIKGNVATLPQMYLWRGGISVLWLTFLAFMFRRS
jgi:hypothetical protein